MGAGRGDGTVNSPRREALVTNFTSEALASLLIRLRSITLAVSQCEILQRSPNNEHSQRFTTDFRVTLARATASSVQGYEQRKHCQRGIRRDKAACLEIR